MRYAASRICQQTFKVTKCNQCGITPLPSHFRCCAQGGSAIADSAHFAAGTKRAFGSEVLSECVGAKSPAYLDEQDVPDRAIERQDSKVKTILFYKVSNVVTAKYLLIYLDADGLIADVDLVED